MNSRCLTVLFLVMQASVVRAQTEALPRSPVAYREGFEQELPDVSVWASDGTQDVHFLGASDERASEGRRSLKLDVTITDGYYHYWGLPLSVACDGELSLHARVFLDPASSPGVSVGFGCNMVYPPTTHSGCGVFERVTRQNAGTWTAAEADLVARGREGRERVLARHTVNVTAEHTGAVLDRWGLFVYARKGDRVVVYLDDIQLRGTVPNRALYLEHLENSFADAKAAFRARVEHWQARLDAARKGVEPVLTLPGLAAQTRQLRETVERASEDVARLAREDYAHPEEVAQVEHDLQALERGPAAIRQLAAQLDAGVPFAVYSVGNPIVDSRSAPSAIPLDAAFGKGVELAACAGEIESVSMGVYAIESLRALTASCTALTGPAGTIPASAVSIRILLWWYQGAGNSIHYSADKKLKAELLVHDPALIRVDHGNKANHLRSTAPDGETPYLLCSGSDSANLVGVRPLDADALQPVDVPAGTQREFWINVSVPPGTEPGTYRGAVRFATNSGRSAQLPITVDVRPFALSPSRLTYSIYYRAKLSADGLPTIGSEYKSAAQYRAEIANMRDHGVLHPTNYQGWGDDPRDLRRTLRIRSELGLPTDAYFNLGRSTGNTSDPAQLRELQRDVRKWRALCADFGYEDVYFYGIDEAKGDRLASQRLTWHAVQKAGGKTFVACYLKTFEAMGELLDCAVLAGRPNPREARKWHGVGSRVFCYAYPQVGVETPATYRRNFGIVLWKAGYDGAMDYAYQHGFNHVWNDFDSTRYRDHNFTYPTLNGVVDTIQWEGFREAVDDVRYLTTLTQAVDRADPDRQDTAREAQAWLDAIDPATVDLVAMRRTAADWIARLGR